MLNPESNWYENTLDPGARSRAMRIPAEFVAVDPQTRTAHIKGHDNKSYDVSLDGCSCRQFAIYRKPCKHMYRLAIELGLMPRLDGVAEDDPSGYIKHDFHLVIDVIERFTEDHQRILLKIVKKASSKSGNVFFNANTKQQPLCRDMMATGMIESASERKFKLADEYADCRYKVNQYLSRKFETSTNYFNEEMPPRFPAGAKMIDTVDPQTGEIIKFLVFPSGDVTDELTARGFNRLNPPVRLKLRDDGGYDYDNEVN